MSPRPVKTARHAVFLATHWKIALVLALFLGPLLLASYLSCAKTPEGCSVFSVITGAARIVIGWFT